MDVSRERFVKIFAISPRAVNDLAARNIIVKSGHNTYDLDLSVMGYCSHLREVAAGRGGEVAVQNLTAERARLAAVQVEEKALKVAKAKGELVAAEGVEREWAAILQKVRAGVLAIPARLQAKLGHLQPRDIAEIDGELRAALGELGRDE